MPPTPTELLISLKLLSHLGAASEGYEPEPHAAFFNCGEYSGASQPHKHIQFVGLQKGQVPLRQAIIRSKPSELKPSESWSLPESIMPAAHYICDISSALSMTTHQAEDFLGACLLGLLDSAIDNVRRLDAAGDEQPARRKTGLSYNLLNLPTYMLLELRSKSDHVFGQAEDGLGDKLSLNALGFAGMILCKKEKHVEQVAQVGVRQILLDVGYPRAVDSDQPS